jgi:ParB-like chromosome segregation protein Spo0J
MKLKINQEYFKLVPRPSPEEYEALKESIKTEGQEIPIIVNGADEILDGFSRNQICNELHIEPKFVRRTFTNKNDEKIFVVEINVKRRHLTTSQKVDMGFALEPLYEERARQRQAATQIKGGKPPAPRIGSIEPNRDEGKTSEQTAKAVGTSRATYERASVSFFLNSRLSLPFI